MICFQNVFFGPIFRITVPCSRRPTTLKERSDWPRCGWVVRMCPGNRFLDLSSGTKGACPPMREHIVIRAGRRRNRTSNNAKSLIHQGFYGWKMFSNEVLITRFFFKDMRSRIPSCYTNLPRLTRIFCLTSHNSQRRKRSVNKTEFGLMSRIRTS